MSDAQIAAFEATMEVTVAAVSAANNNAIVAYHPDKVVDLMQQVYDKALELAEDAYESEEASTEF